MWRRDLLGSAAALSMRELVPASPYTYLALGDSSGVGVGARGGGGYVDRAFARIVRARPDAKLVNLCESGATSETARIGQASRAERIRASLVTVFLGVNDLWRGTGSARFGENVDAILSAIRVSSSAAALLVGTLPEMQYAPAAEYAERHLGVTKRALERHIAAFNREVYRVADLHRADVVDLNAVHLAARPHYFSADGFHPSDSGYDAWTEELWKHVERVVRPS